MTAAVSTSSERSPIDLFADHWENPSEIEARIRAHPHRTLGEYGIHAPEDREIRLAVNEHGLFNLRVLMDIEHDAPFWEIGSLTEAMIGVLFSFTHCPVRTWCAGGLEFATPRYLEVMERCRNEPGYLERFQRNPGPELDSVGIPIPDSFRINVRICDRNRVYIVLLAPRGAAAAADLRVRTQALRDSTDDPGPTLRDLWIRRHRHAAAHSGESEPAADDGERAPMTAPSIKPGVDARRSPAPRTGPKHHAAISESAPPAESPPTRAHPGLPS